MAFSFLAWNVEHFRANPDVAARAVRIAQHIRAQDPDVFGLFEVETVDVVRVMLNEFPDYTFELAARPTQRTPCPPCRSPSGAVVSP